MVVAKVEINHNRVIIKPCRQTGGSGWSIGECDV